MNKKVTIFIGIDPDLEKCGVAVWDKLDKSIETYSFNVAELIEELKMYIAPIHVVLEAGWLIKKSNWHGKNGNVANRIAKNVGENHASGKIIEQFLIKMGISYELVKPKGKINADMFAKITGIKRSNQDVRDAVMLVYGL
jgi:hypothetical protein